MRSSSRRSLDSMVPLQDEPLATFLEMSGISKRFGGVRALRDVDLTLEVGEVHCLVGENGSGKSTLIKIISGVEAPEPGGRIAICGKEYPKLNPVYSTHCGIQVIYQDLSLFPNLNVAENIAMPHHLDGLRRVNWPSMRAIAMPSRWPQWRRSALLPQRRSTAANSAI